LDNRGRPTSNLETRRVGWLLLARQNAQAPTDAEWDRFLALLGEAREHFEHVKILVLTEGGSPSAPQRERLATTLAGKSVRVAVVTNSVKVRFVAAMVALFHKEMRCFARQELRLACSHVGMTPEEANTAERILDEMSEEIAL
jgi:hypothetical protein